MGGVPGGHCSFPFVPDLGLPCWVDAGSPGLGACVQLSGASPVTPRCRAQLPHRLTHVWDAHAGLAAFLHCVWFLGPVSWLQPRPGLQTPLQGPGWVPTSAELTPPSTSAAASHTASEQRPASHTEHVAKVQALLGKQQGSAKGENPGTGPGLSVQVRHTGLGGLPGRGASVHGRLSLDAAPDPAEPIPSRPQFMSENFLCSIVCKRKKMKTTQKSVNRETVELWCNLWNILQPSR